MDNVETLQFAVFLKQPAVKNAVDLWGQAFGGELPDNFHQTPLGGSVASGIRDHWQLTMSVQPNRLDLVFAAAGDTPQALSTIESPEKAVALARKMILEFIPHLSVLRPAVVFQTAQVAETSIHAVDMVLANVPGIPVAPGSLDLLYQTVVPIASKVRGDATIHRLCRWNTGKKALVRMEVNTGVSNEAESVICAFQYADVFVAPPVDMTNGEFEHFFDEIVGEAKKILEQGYNAIR